MPFTGTGLRSEKQGLSPETGCARRIVLAGLGGEAGRTVAYGSPMFSLFAVFAALPALAGPLSPVLPAGDAASLQVAAHIGSEKRRYTDPFCDGDDCRAVRSMIGPGLEIEGRFLPFLGAWVNAGRFKDQTDAALFAGIGYYASGGLEGEFRLGEGASALQVWVGGDYARSTDSDAPSHQITSLDLEIGLAGRVGDPRDGGAAWLGVDVVPLSSTTASLRDGFAVPLVPALPGSVVFGGSLSSRPLAGPWASRGRMEFGAHAALGFRNEARVWLGFGW